MPSVRRRLIAATLVMVVGAISAFPFYRIAPQVALTARPESPSETNSTQPGTIALQLSTGETDNAENPEPANRSFAAPFSSPSTSSGDTTGGSQPLIPKLSNRHPSAEETVPPVAPIRKPVLNSLSSLPEGPSLPEEDRDNRQRMHRIIDGDSLEELALRFLGDRTRWQEIRDANRDVLTMDDILPIGKQIRIPSREEGKSQTTSHTADEKAGLVPIPWQVK